MSGPEAGEAPQAGALRSFVAALPKVELHVHLEGSIQPATLLRLARRHGISLPADDEAGLARWFAFRDFPHFAEIYGTCSSCLRDPEDFHLLTLDFLAEQARQNVVWSEVHFTISTHLANGVDGEAIRQALAAAAAEGLRRWGVRVAWIPDIVRNMPVARADRTIEWALDARSQGLVTSEVIALGCAGIERGYPPQPFAAHFDAALAGGLHRVVHAGEHEGPASIWAALETLGAERIGHGIRAVDDPELLAVLAARQVPVEVCPSSNVCLGAAPSLADHPFDRLCQAGLAVSVNSDDPPLFSTTLVDEYLRLAATFGYTPADLAGLALAAIRDSFLTEADKTDLADRLRQTAVEKGVELFGEEVIPV